MTNPSELFGQDQVLIGDDIFKQLQSWLEEHGQELPTTPQRPDVRLIINNTGTEDITFKNPAGHSIEDEVIPYEHPKGKTAAMFMLHGHTLAEQQQNAAMLDQEYGLSEKGFTSAFLEDFRSGALSGIIKEAYGPAPMQEQAKKFETISWTNEDGTTDTIKPVTGENAAFGIRPPSNEIVFTVRVADTGRPVHLDGSDTSAEKLVTCTDGYKTIAVEVSPVRDENWQPTGEYTTRPVAPKAAEEAYGQGYHHIPVLDLDEKGQITSVDLAPVQADQPQINRIATLDLS